MNVTEYQASKQKKKQSKKSCKTKQFLPCYRTFETFHTDNGNEVWPCDSSPQRPIVSISLECWHAAWRVSISLMIYGGHVCGLVIHILLHSCVICNESDMRFQLTCPYFFDSCVLFM